MFFAAFLASAPKAQLNTAEAENLQRRYVDGAVSHYTMTGDNDGWRYSIQAADTVRRDTAGRFYEELAWSELSSNTQPTLNAASQALRQTVSLDDPAHYMKVPNLAGVQPLLIGPITDTLTFYSDLLLAMHANLSRVGQTAYVPRTTANSWADDQHVLVGEDVVDVSLRVEAVDPASHTETILIQHVPPAALHIQVPAPWMQSAASTPPYNFVQVTKTDAGFATELGKEHFDVRLVLDTQDGHLVSATMHNPVSMVAQQCTDRDLKQCGPESQKSTLREVTWKEVR